VRGLLAVSTVAALIVASCGEATEEATTILAASATTSGPIATTDPSDSTMEISSPAFEQGGEIPVRFTCDGEDVSPELRITGIPEGASLALIVDDPDAPAGTWDHWVEYDIPTSGPELTIAENAGQLGTPGLNSSGETGYGGPCPPPGTPHRYFFRVYALDAPLSIPGEADSDALRTAMEGHVLAEAELMGTFER
jgi:hypothetical protein